MLQSTHFYGRHLVLQYAKADQSVEGLRDKLKAQLTAEASAAGAKRSKSNHNGNSLEDSALSVDL